MNRYYLVWIHEEQRWYSFKDSFDESRFKDGYVSYEILVEDGIIVKDEWYRDTIGKPFEKCYPGINWE